MRISVRRVAPVCFVCVLPVAVFAMTPGCGPTDEPYKPTPAYSGRKASLPAVPSLPNKPIKVGDGYTVFGAMHHLRSRVHNADVNAKELNITGYIVQTNLPDAPACAVHKTGKGDKEDCKSPVPAFWVADEKGGTQKDAIKVMGWASNFAQIFDAVEKYSKPPSKNPKDNEPVMDEFWAVAIPNPVPNVGAKVNVSGNFAVSFTKATSSVETDPTHGILTYGKMTYLEPPPEPGTLPGMKQGGGGGGKKK